MTGDYSGVELAEAVNKYVESVSAAKTRSTLVFLDQETDEAGVEWCIARVQADEGEIAVAVMRRVAGGPWTGITLGTDVDLGLLPKRLQDEAWG